MKSTKDTKDYSFRPHSISAAWDTGGELSSSHAGSRKYIRTRPLSRSTPINATGPTALLPRRRDLRMPEE